MQCHASLLDFGYTAYAVCALVFLLAWYLISIRPLLETGDSWLGRVMAQGLVRFAPIVERMNKGSRLLAVLKILISFFQLLGTFLSDLNPSALNPSS